MRQDEVLTKPRYKHAPIQEAICEVHFAMGTALDEAAVARMQPVWRDQYPDQRVVTEQNLQLHLGLDGVDAKSIAVGHKLIARSSEGRDLAQLGPRFLAVNRLRPYPGWETPFRDTILTRLQDVVEVHHLEQVTRIGLRYINRIDIPEVPAKWSDWFAVSLPVPGGFGESGGLFQFRFEKPLPGGLLGIINFASLPTTPHRETSVMLDLDVVWRGSVPVGSVRNVLEQVHEPHGRLFEGYLMDRTRALFHIPG